MRISWQLLDGMNLLMFVPFALKPLEHSCTFIKRKARKVRVLKCLETDWQEIESYIYII